MGLGISLDATFPNSYINAFTTGVVATAGALVSSQVLNNVLNKVVTWQPLALASTATALINRIAHRVFVSPVDQLGAQAKTDTEGGEVLQFASTAVLGTLAGLYIPRAFSPAWALDLPSSIITSLAIAALGLIVDRLPSAGARVKLFVGDKSLEGGVGVNKKGANIDLKAEKN